VSGANNIIALRCSQLSNRWKTSGSIERRLDNGSHKFVAHPSFNGNEVFEGGELITEAGDVWLEFGKRLAVQLVKHKFSEFLKSNGSRKSIVGLP
jgi:hypothetical protein